MPEHSESQRLREGVSVSGLSFGYPETDLLFHDVSCFIRPSEIIGLIGTSGCGKSTLLRLVGGLLQPLTGDVRIDGDSPATAANLGALSFAFQQPALLPWRSCLDNILIPLFLLHRPRDDRFIQGLMSAFGLSGHERKFPHELSGGLAQRASLARALVIGPKLLLLDEPLSSIDWPLRRSVLLFIRDYCKTRGVTTLVVSHDSRELAFLCDRVLVVGGDCAQRFREFCLPPLEHNAINTFTSAEFFRICISLDEFAYDLPTFATVG